MKSTPSPQIILLEVSTRSIPWIILCCGHQWILQMTISSTYWTRLTSPPCLLTNMTWSWYVWIVHRWWRALNTGIRLLLRTLELRVKWSCCISHGLASRRSWRNVVRWTLTTGSTVTSMIQTLKNYLMRCIFPYRLYHRKIFIWWGLRSVRKRTCTVWGLRRPWVVLNAIWYSTNKTGVTPHRSWKTPVLAAPQLIPRNKSPDWPRSVAWCGVNTLRPR